MAVFALLASCKKNADEPTNLEVKENLSPDIELAVKGATSEIQPMHQPYVTYNFLGFGYDAADKYDSEVAVRASVIDIPTYAASSQNNILQDSGTSASWETFEAEDAANLSAQLSNSYQPTAGLKLFGNTIVNAFPESAVTDKKYLYGYYYNYAITKRFYLFYDDRANNYLTADFKRDLDLLSAKDLVHKYGTHVLTGIKLGSKFEVFYQAEAPQQNRKKIATEGLRYALKRTFSLLHGYLDDVNLSNLNANSAAKIYYNPVGGEIGKLKPETVNGSVKLNITNWLNSSTKDNVRFIGVYRDGLVRLDSFIDNPVKKAEVTAYLDQYFAEKSVKLVN